MAYLKLRGTSNNPFGQEVRTEEDPAVDNYQYLISTPPTSEGTSTVAPQSSRKKFQI